MTVNLKEVEDWEKEFIKELSQFPLLSSADIIKGVGYSAKHLKNIKKKMSQMAESEARASGVPISAVDPDNVPQVSVESTRAPPMVLIDSPATSSHPTEMGSPLGGKRATVDQISGRSGKRANLSEIDRFHGGHPELSLESLATSSDKSTVEKLGISGTFNVLQWYAGYSMVLARAVEVEFASIEKHNHSLVDRLASTHGENVKLITVCFEAEAKIGNYRDATARLQEDLQRTIVKNKDLMLVNFELETVKDNLAAQVETFKTAALSLEEKLFVAESTLVQVQEAKDQIIQAKDHALDEQERSILEQYECCFGRALEQVKLLYLDLDVSEVDPFKEIVDGQLVSIPTSPDSPAS
ncbi:hypothetical protein CR513_40751, partial [Mucuna pruriens]